MTPKLSLDGNIIIPSAVNGDFRSSTDEVDDYEAQATPYTDMIVQQMHDNTSMASNRFHSKKPEIF